MTKPRSKLTATGKPRKAERDAASSTARRPAWHYAALLAIVAVIGYVAYDKVGGGGSSSSTEDASADRGRGGRSVGPDLADALGKARAKRTGMIDWDTNGPQDGIVITGSVIELTTHAPVGDVEVVFRSPAGEETTTAGADGKYSIRMPPGIYRAFVRDDLLLSVGRSERVRLPGPPSVETAGVPDEALMPQVMANRNIDGIDLTVMRGGTVLGKVVDGNGKPIAGAVISAIGQFRPTLGTDIAESDDAGAFTLRIPAGGYGVDAMHPRFAGVRDREGIFVQPGDSITTTITLVAGCVISGRVLGPDGKPAADGAMERKFSDDPSETGFGPSGRVEPDGSFRWVTLDEGTVTLRAWPWKSPPSDIKKFACKDGARFPNTEFKIPTRAADIEGVLVDHDGQPVPFAFVDLAPLDPGGIGQQERTDAEGRWGVYAMPAGRYTLTAEASERGVATLQVASPQTGIRVVLGGTGRIEGTTTTLVDGSFELQLAACRTDTASIEIGGQRRLVAVKRGRFEVENVPACDLTFLAMWQGRRTSGNVVVPVNGSATVQIDVGPPREKTVVGRVTNDGKPVAGATVTAVTDDSKIASATTDADGSYTLKTYSGATVSVIAEGMEQYSQVGNANVDREQLDFDLTEREHHDYDDDYIEDEDDVDPDDVP